MTLWLKQRLVAWMGVSLLGVALLWNGEVIRAQGAFKTESLKPPPKNRKLTVDVAARSFVSFLNTGNDDMGALYEWAGSSVVAAKNRREMPLTGEVEEFMDELRAEWKRTTYDLKVVNTKGKMAIVTLENNTLHPVRPLVLIEENGGWGVDVTETYAKWNSLQGVSRKDALARLAARGANSGEERAHSFKCQTNLKQIALGMAQYAQDYDERFPLANSWTDGVQPYVKNADVFNCPALPESHEGGYAFNSKMSSQYQPNLADTAKIVALYETTLLKRNAYGMGENLAFRHLRGANYAFADGHVKWFSETRIPSFKLKP